MVSQYLLGLLFTSLLSSASPLAQYHSLARSQAAKTETSISHFVIKLNITQNETETLLDTLQDDKNVEAFLVGKDYDKSQLARLSCTALKHALGVHVVMPTAVEQIVQQSWSETCWLIPSCIIIPKTAQEVSLVLTVVNFFQTKFAVRSGGHSPNPGFSTLSDPGVLIDMQDIDQVTINNDMSVATVGSGTKWIDVYQVLDQYGITVVGGRGPTVGAGGFMLGGGYFHWASKYGMAVDNVKDFEIVLADGTITNANMENNTDLFWALKGGGPNFGIITHMELYTIPIRNIWYQLAVYSSEHAHALIDAFGKWQKDGASDTRGTVGFVIGLETTTVILLWSEHAVKPELFAPFYDIPQIQPAGSPTNSTLVDLTNLLAFVGGEGSARHDYRTVSVKVDVELYKDVYEFWRPKAQAVHDATGANLSFVFQPVPKSIAEAGSKNGGNAMGIPMEDQMWWDTSMDWFDAADDDTVRGLAIETTNKWEELGRARGSYLSFKFLNEASRDQNPLASYGGENLQRLQEIAAKYDPMQLFQKVQNSGFLLSNT